MLIPPGLLMGIAGTIILLLVAAVAFFVIAIIRDVKQNTKDISKVWGMVTANNERHNGDIKHLNERIELQIQQVNKNVDDLTNLVRSMLKHIIKDSKDRQD